MEEIERENALRYMLMVYLGESRWAKMQQAGRPFGAESPPAQPLGDVAVMAAG
jgi:hypothetical protein